jgi:hypothetical protein
MTNTGALIAKLSGLVQTGRKAVGLAVDKAVANSQEETPNYGAMQTR